MKVSVIETIGHEIPVIPLRGEEKHVFAGTWPFIRLKRWLWERWGELFVEARIVATRHLIDIHEEKLGDLIGKALEKLNLRLEDVECIIAGPNDVAKYEFQVMQHRWDFNLPMMEGSYRQHSIMGIRIKVIPWINEIIIVPKEQKGGPR